MGSRWFVRVPALFQSGCFARKVNFWAGTFKNRLHLPADTQNLLSGRAGWLRVHQTLPNIACSGRAGLRPRPKGLGPEKRVLRCGFFLPIPRRPPLTLAVGRFAENHEQRLILRFAKASER